ncbi:ADP-ribose glycohydrolase OARD1-like [Dysidea avara]|uniref:ADP-ribose glycohydrolase OARD1-like n=1 Tax=Dysidea avara TaxID=196820 RepID=UPI0033198FB1
MATAGSGQSTAQKLFRQDTPANEDKQKLTEIKGDLFSCDPTSSLAHCVSADLHMGKGIAVLFKKKFGCVAELKSQGVQPGGVAVLKRSGQFIYYLVTKARYFHKPTMETLQKSLEALCSHAVSNGVKKLAIPRLGCGLDKLNWSAVSKLIGDIFSESGIEITVYYL